MSRLHKRDNAGVRARLRAETHMYFGVQARLDEWVSMRIRLADYGGVCYKINCCAGYWTVYVVALPLPSALMSPEATSFLSR